MQPLRPNAPHPQPPFEAHAPHPQPPFEAQAGTGSPGDGSSTANAEGLGGAGEERLQGEEHMRPRPPPYHAARSASPPAPTNDHPLAPPHPHAAGVSGGTGGPGLMHPLQAGYPPQAVQLPHPAQPSHLPHPRQHFQPLPGVVHSRVPAPNAWPVSPASLWAHRQALAQPASPPLAQEEQGVEMNSEGPEGNARRR
jgi:hypothetical protein